ncbi:sciellin [Ctenodactylus gundi]
MANFPLRKKSPTGNEMKSITQGTLLRQQGLHEVNKRRTFLQDSSWIKNYSEEEKNENYGRVVLSRHNSHDALDRKTNEKVSQPKAALSRYRSDNTLDRISERNGSAETPKADTLDSRLTNRQPGDLLSANIPKATATVPVKKKRQSWFPPPPPGSSTIPSIGASRRDPAVYPPIPPKPSSPVSSPSQLRRDNRHICLPKPSMYTETNRSAERNISEELDNIIKMNKSLNRNQGLDGLFRANYKAEQIEKRAKSLESLIFMNTQMDKDGKGGEDLDNVLKVSLKRNENTTGKQDLTGVVKVNPETNKNIKSPKDLNNLIKLSPTTGKSIQRDSQDEAKISLVTNPIAGAQVLAQDSRKQDLDSLIKVNPSASKSSEKDLNELINVSPTPVKNTAGNEDLDKLIKVKPETLTKNQKNQDLDNLIQVKPAIIRSNQSQDLDNLIKVKPSALRNANGDHCPENLTEVNSHVSENTNGRINGQVNGFTKALHSDSMRTSTYSYETRDDLSSGAGTRHARPKDTIVYTRTYVEKSTSSGGGYQETISGKYIQTVYSTSDRSVIERDMCTYCRKPLGVETKMILDELQICCHSTCFKCEICRKPLENLRAGDSIWIYRQTIHCEPCYSKVMASCQSLSVPLVYSLVLPSSSRTHYLVITRTVRRTNGARGKHASRAGTCCSCCLDRRPWREGPRRAHCRQQRAKAPLAGKFGPRPIRHLGLGGVGGCGGPRRCRPRPLGKARPRPPRARAPLPAGPAPGARAPPTRGPRLKPGAAAAPRGAEGRTEHVRSRAAAAAAAESAPGGAGVLMRAARVASVPARPAARAAVPATEP